MISYARLYRVNFAFEQSSECPMLIESNGPSDAYVAISNADRLQAEPESLRKWREEQSERLEQLDANSRKQEVEWKEKAKLELEEWHTRQNEQLEKTKVNNRYTTLFEQLKSIRGLVSVSCCLITKALESACPLKKETFNIHSLMCLCSY
uniref:Clathrin light chain n=1 Tax=Sinocyclocheilus anshuiensis TaxID=1608454 RepID=A0A671RMA6_9TELE